jgi:hypothetical protein
MAVSLLHIHKVLAKLLDSTCMLDLMHVEVLEICKQFLVITLVQPEYAMFIKCP